VPSPTDPEWFVDLVEDEVNVKDVELTTDLAAHATFEITVNAWSCLRAPASCRSIRQ
jgi:hypothetical protein